MAKFELQNMPIAISAHFIISSLMRMLLFRFFPLMFLSCYQINTAFEMLQMMYMAQLSAVSWFFLFFL